jgi:hypothetical protein
MGSVALFGFSIIRTFKARQAGSVPIELGVQKTTDIIEVDTGKLVRIAVRANIQGYSVQEETEFGETEYKLRYDFPVSYRVSDEKGAVIFSETTRMNWDTGCGHYSRDDVTSAGGAMSAEQPFDKFEVPPPGKVKVEVRVDPDTRHQAQARSLQLIVYDNVSSHAARIRAGLIMLLLGPPLVISGGIVFIIGLASRKRRPPEFEDQGGYPVQDPRR